MKFKVGDKVKWLSATTEPAYGWQLKGPVTATGIVQEVHPGSRFPYYVTCSESVPGASFLATEDELAKLVINMVNK